MSSVLNSKNLLWLALVAVPLFTAGCPVDVNEGTPGDDGPPPPDECPATELATVRIFHAAAGTPVIRPEFGPASTPNLLVLKPDPEAPDEPEQIASLVAGRSAIVQLCAAAPVTLALRLDGAEVDRVSEAITFTPDADSTLLNVGTTLVLAGIADKLNANGMPENPASAADPLRFLVVPDSFSANMSSEIIAVHASTRLGPIVVKTASTEATPVTSESAIVARYGVSAPLAIKGTGDGISSAEAPVAVSVTAVEGETNKARFGIAPRFPAQAKAIGIIYDRIIYDPNAPAGTSLPPPSTRLFLTGDDPLLGFVPGGGVVITSSI